MIRLAFRYSACESVVDLAIQLCKLAFIIGLENFARDWRVNCQCQSLNEIANNLAI